MFFYVVGTHTKCIINDFSPAPRTNIWIFKCHTVTHGTDLRKSPQGGPEMPKCKKCDGTNFFHCLYTYE